MKTDWLRERRKRLGLSQEDIVARLELEGLQVSRAMISHWETGRNALPLDDPKFRKALANALRFTVFDLLVAAGYEIENTVHTQEGRIAASIVDQLPENQRKLAINVLEQFLAQTS